MFFKINILVFGFYGFMFFKVFMEKVKNSLKTRLYEVHCMILLK